MPARAASPARATHQEGNYGMSRYKQAAALTGALLFVAASLVWPATATVGDTRDLPATKVQLQLADEGVRCG